MKAEQTAPRFRDLKIKIFSDGADLDSIIEAYQKGDVSGFTTNPTLMSRAGITNYMTFATEVLRVVTDLPVSFEVFSDDFAEMKEQALKLADLAENVYVKIPVTNTKGKSACPLIKDLAGRGLKLNVTAILTLKQVEEVAAALNPKVPAIVSVFAGRIADTGRDPVPYMKESLKILKPLPLAELLWASPREILNLVQADEIGCHIITVTPAVLSKAGGLGRDLAELSLDTVRMFYNDAQGSGFTI
ncbi:MAG TPA: transaldolase [Kiritimatiellia bacterium]|nr:transaldolase [Kiritimatiellia bacterium]HNS82073.1 transaldolase [Kiritimatiellia bacterium]HQQ05134.1 transaldolase [Kiritimatiellia bacterium]